MLQRKKMMVLFIVLLLLASSIYLVFYFGKDKKSYNSISIEDVLNLVSTRNEISDMVLVSDAHELLPLIATPVACWYNIGGSNDSGPNSLSGLKPMLISTDNKLEPNQERLINYLQLDTALILGNVEYNDDFRATGTAGELSSAAAQRVYSSAAGAMIIEDNTEGYRLGTAAVPMASYLNIPVLVKDSSVSYSSMKSTLGNLNAQYVIILGSSGDRIASELGFDTILMENTKEINDNALVVIKHRFGEINYVTLANPGDVIPPYVEDQTREDFTVNVNNVRIRTGNTDRDIVGESTHVQDITVPEGINRLQIYINFTNIASKPMDPFKDAVEIEPLIFAYLYDKDGRLAAYAPSFSFEIGKNYLETLVIDCAGTYRLEISVYYGTRGFSTYAGTEFGISNIEGTYEISAVTSILSKPHLPLYPELSMMAPYLTASHGGIVISDPDFELTADSYAGDASGYATGPYYETGLHDTVNKKVSYILEELNSTLESFKDQDLYESYFNGPAWLAILAGSNMIPHYYEPKEASWVEETVHGVGWATDIKYSLGEQLSYGRPLGRNVGQVSTLIARTLFYEPYAEGHTAMIKQQYGSSEDWGSNFHFLAGELGGRTGWFFWQREFAPEIEQHQFQTEQYFQNYENDRQTMIMMGAYERANFMDLMMHGNWYWYTTELNGVDSYSTSVKNSDILKAPSDWELGPSTFITGSCLLGRIDGIPPEQQITLVFIDAGINALFGASRTTGSEAKAGTVEKSMLYDDLSVGEALRADKNTNREPAAFYVRMLFADPAFNPYEPENGYSDQGRPVLVTAGAQRPEDVKVPRDVAGRTPTLPVRTDETTINFDDDFTEYYDYDTMAELLHEIALNHSEITALYSIGVTYEGRDIWALKISDNPLEYENEPEVLFTGAHHGREWPSYEVPLYFLRYLVENYGKTAVDNDQDGQVNEDVYDGVDNDGDGQIDEDENEARITWLIDNRQIWIVPMVNPDGVSYSHEQRESGRVTDDNLLWRKNREPNRNPVTGDPYPETMGGKDMWGVDLNRNYGFHWGELGYQGNTDPSREDYIGPVDKIDQDNDRRLNEDRMDNQDNDGDGKIDEDIRGGFSATETRAIKRLVEEHDFVIALNFHTYGDVIYWPWVWTLELTPDEDLFFSLAKEMSRYNGYDYRNMSERAQQSLSRHPPVDGDSNDWMYGKENILSYTIEIGTQFIPPEEEILEICKKHVGANLFVVEVADDPSQRKAVIEHQPLSDTTNTEGYMIKAVVRNPSGPELKSSGLKVYYTLDGKSYRVLNMEPSGGQNEYQVEIPGQAPGTTISYYFTVTNRDEHTAQLPAYAPYNLFSFTVKSEKSGYSYTMLGLGALLIMVVVLVIIVKKYNVSLLGSRAKIK